MKSASLALLALSLFLVACGPGPEPEVMEGEETAPAVVTTFLRALQANDYEKAEQLLYRKADYILKDFDHCQELFFSERPTGMSVLKTGHERYAREWHIYVDLKINYGPQKMKQLHFVLYPGELPKLRSVNPIVPVQ